METNQEKRSSKKTLVKTLAISAALVGVGYLIGNKSARTKIGNGAKSAWSWTTGKVKSLTTKKNQPAPSQEQTKPGKSEHGYGYRETRRPEWKN